VRLLYEQVRAEETSRGGDPLYNQQRPHQGRWCFGKTPMQTFLDARPIAKEKLMAAWPQATANRFKQPTPSVRLRIVLEDYIAAVEAAEARRDRLTAQIEAILPIGHWRRS
jgi:hypothetical protein